MKRSLILVILLTNLNISAAVQRSIVLEKEISNTDCEATDSCTLKKFNIQVSEYVVTRNKQKSYGTSAYISYETNSVVDIEDYAVVQFIKGCVYDEVLGTDGVRIKRKGYARKFFGSYQKFFHPEWVIDSIDHDPIYNSSDVSDTRHDYYRWNENPNSYSENGEHYILRRTPEHPKVYVSDLPSTSFYSDLGAKNTNLALRSCIYKTEDVPRILAPTDIHFARPLHCIDWRTTNVYNFETSTFEKDVSIEESCGDL